MRTTVLNDLTIWIYFNRKIIPIIDSNTYKKTHWNLDYSIRGYARGFV